MQTAGPSTTEAKPAGAPTQVPAAPALAPTLSAPALSLDAGALAPATPSGAVPASGAGTDPLAAIVARVDLPPAVTATSSAAATPSVTTTSSAAATPSVTAAEATPDSPPGPVNSIASGPPPVTVAAAPPTPATMKAPAAAAPPPAPTPRPEAVASAPPTHVQPREPRSAPPPTRLAERERTPRRSAGTLGDQAAALGTSLTSGTIAIVPNGARGGGPDATTLALADMPARTPPGRTVRAGHQSLDDAAPTGSATRKGKASTDSVDADAAGRSARHPHGDRTPPPAPAPARVWVQVAGGANKRDLPKAWAKLKGAAPDLYAGRTPSTVPFRFTNRLLIGPFNNDDEAQAYVNRLTKGGQSGFIVRTPGGQKVDKVGD